MDGYGPRKNPSITERINGLGKFLRLLAMNKKSKEYKESELSSLLVEWSKENGHQGVKKIMPSIMKGLPITISSKPDIIAPLDKRGSKNDVQILMGGSGMAKPTT
eukprot:scaffold9442_cov72-Cylindrotheca_fusiformis.AAC.3